MTLFTKICLALASILLVTIAVLFWMIGRRGEEIAALELLAEETNRMTPLAIDEVTQLDRVYTEGLALVLNHTVTDKRITRDHYDRRIKAWFENSICQQSKIGPQVKVVYNFYNADESLLVKYQLKPSSCDH